MAQDPNSLPPTRPPQPEAAKEAPTVMVPQRTPKVLGGNKLIKRVGVGGMGEVWLGMDIKLQRQVAVKVMLPELLKTTPDAAQRFYQEARAVAKLNHQNIIQIFQIGEEGGLLYFSMEWVDGESLQDYLKRHGQLDPLAALELTLQIIDGLAFAASSAVIHRDVKPANVMLDKRGRVKITDFGLAKIQDSDASLTSSGVSMGSPNYMSPEMAKGEIVNHRADIYAVGITLYQMIMGNVPFTGPSATAVLLKHIQEPLPVPKLLEEKAGRFVVDIIRKMTEKDPERRYQTYESLRSDVVAALDMLREKRSDGAVTAPAGKESLIVASSPTAQFEIVNAAQHSPTPAPAPAAPDAKPSKAPVIAAVVMVALLLLVIVIGAVAYVVMKKGGVALPTAGGPTLLAAEPSVKGEMFLKLQVGTDSMAGQKVQLYGDVEMERLGQLRDELRTQKRTIEGLAESLRLLLDDIRGGSTAQEKVARFNEELDGKKLKADGLKRDGQRLQSEVGQYETMLTQLKTQYEDFKKKGYTSYRLVDPLTQISYDLAASGPKGASSRQIFEGVIASCDQQISGRKARMKTLAEDLKALEAESADLEKSIRVATSGGDKRPMEEKKADFKQKFAELAYAQTQRLKTIEKLADPALVPLAETTADKDGKFVFQKVKSGRYMAKAAFDTRWTAGGDQRDSHAVVWIESVDAGADEQAAVKLTQDNVLVYTRRDVLASVGRTYNDEDLSDLLDFFLDSKFEKGINATFEAYAESVMTP